MLILTPIGIILTLIGGLTVNNEKNAENQLLLDRFNSFRVLLESGDLSFDTTQDKAKLENLLSEKVVLSEILRNDYSVVYSSENSALPLISESEKNDVDNAFAGFETIKNEVGDNGEPVLSVVTPLVVNNKVVAVLHQVLSREEYFSRVRQYSIFIISISLVGIIVSYLSIHILLYRLVLRNIFKLKRYADEIKKGKLDTKIDIKTEDEIGELAASFNQMVKKLLESRRHIEKNMEDLSREHSKLSSLVEGVRLGVVMVDLNLNVILANSAAKSVVSGSPDKDFSFKELSKKIKGKMDVSQALSYYVKSGKFLNIQEAMINDRYFRFFMSPVRDIAEKVFIGAVMVMEDITEEKELDKMRTEIISITSHQLRTPSTIVKGNLEMILGGDLGKVNKKQKELLDDTYLGNQRMIRLINDLMDVAKIDEGKFVLNTESVHLEDLVDNVVNALKPFAKEKKVSLSYDRPKDSLAPVKINSQRVGQVLQNLIDNAIKYSSGQKKGEVNIQLREGVKFIEFLVADNGIGIPEKEQGKMFERFSRGSNSTKLDPGGGSGLGLYIAKAIVESGGGKLWFESKENAGTTFHATFPYDYEEKKA